MEFAEKMILSKFKNSLNDKSFSNLVFDDFNFKSESSSTKKESKQKDKIFICVKIPKNRKLEEIQKMLMQNHSHENNNNGESTSFNNGYHYGHNIPVKDQHLIQQENFIHSCLDSHDPNDLTKMMIYFNNSNDTATSTIPSGINESIRNNNANDKLLFNVNSVGAGYDLMNNNNQYYRNIKHIKDNFDIDFKGYGFNAIQQEVTHNTNNNGNNTNSFDNKDVMKTKINQEEEGQYFMGLLNDNIKPKSIPASTPPPDSNTPTNKNIANTNTKSNNNNNNANLNFIIDQSQINPNLIQQSAQYFYNLQGIQQRNPMRQINNHQQSAFSSHNQNQNQNQNHNNYIDDLFKHILNQQNGQNPQFYQQYIP